MLAPIMRPKRRMKSQGVGEKKISKIFRLGGGAGEGKGG